MNLRDLRYFLVAADEGSFTAAAKRCFIAQQGLSAAIRRVESEIGCDLFLREHGGVQLTDAGLALYGRAAEILRLSDETLDVLRGETRGEQAPGLLRVGIVSPAASELVPLILETYRRARPNVSVTMRQVRFDELRPALDHRQVDVALTIGPLQAPPAWRTTQLFVEPHAALLPIGHPLAGEPSVRIVDLLDETWVAGASLPADWVRFSRMEDHRGGQPPRLADAIASYVRTPVEVNEVVASSIAITTAPLSHGRAYPHPKVACVPIRDSPGVEVLAVRRRGQPAPLADAFAAITASTIRPLRDLLESAGPRPAAVLAAMSDRHGRI